jgi:hypothetical protein
MMLQCPLYSALLHQTIAKFGTENVRLQITVGLDGLGAFIGWCKTHLKPGGFYELIFLGFQLTYIE